MGVVHYDGINDFILFGSPTTALQAVPTGDKTLVTVVRREVAGAWGGLITLETSGAAAQTNMEAGSDNLFWFGDASASSGTATTGFGTNTTDYVFKAGVHTGALVARLSSKNLTTGSAVTREPTASTLVQSSNIGAGGLLRFGMWQGSDPFTGWQVVAAIFNGSLTDAQVDECYANQRTSDIWNCSFGRPLVLVEFNTLTPFDLAGNCALSSVNAPTLDAAETPPWTFDGVGGVLGKTYTPQRMPLGV